jgi:hypothetical protein
MRRRSRPEPGRVGAPATRDAAGGRRSSGGPGPCRAVAGSKSRPRKRLACRAAGRAHRRAAGRTAARRLLEHDVPIGPDNCIEPGGPDGGQPAHFFPRRNRFVFSVAVPADFGDKEVVWTLTTNGVTERAYGTLRHQYAVDDVVMSANFGAGGEPVTLSAIVTDDGKPAPRAMSAALVGHSHFVPNSATGLRFSWHHYRGPGPVAFDPPRRRCGRVGGTGVTRPGRPVGRCHRARRTTGGPPAPPSVSPART